MWIDTFVLGALTAFAALVTLYCGVGVMLGVWSLTPYFAVSLAATAWMARKVPPLP